MVRWTASSCGARALRPVVAAADHILDLHSTSQPVVPFWVYPQFERNAATALALSQPATHLVMPAGLGSGTPVIQHGWHGQADGQGVALVAECGQHFQQASGDRAIKVFKMKQQRQAFAPQHPLLAAGGDLKTLADKCHNTSTG